MICGGNGRCTSHSALLPGLNARNLDLSWAWYIDSGSVVPTLSSGFSETLAAKLLTVARARRGGAVCPRLAASCRAAVAGALESMLLRRAFFLAVDKAGRSSPARTAMIRTTTSSSISVNARERIFIGHLGGFLP